MNSRRNLLRLDQPPARVALEACREASFVPDQWGNNVALIDTTRSKHLGIAQHGCKTALN